MQLLFLSSWFPYPPDTGGKIRIFNLLKQLSKNHEVTFLSFSRAGPVSDDRRARLGEFCEALEPVVLRHPRRLLGRLLPNPRWHSNEMWTRIRQATESSPFDLVVAAEVLAGFYAAEVRGIPRILDNCELTVLIERCMESNRVRRLRNQLEWRTKRKFTASLARKFDACTVVSEQERKHLLSIAPDCSVDVVPNGVDISAHALADKEPEAGTLIYPGALTYHANLDAMEYFVSDVAPRIHRRCPTARLAITGAHTGVDTRRLQGTGFPVELPGFLPDVKGRIARSQVCVVPLRVGGGTRLKILEAMALGTPVVSTTKGAEGLHVQHNENILIADCPDEFADAVCRLLEQHSLRSRIVSNARRLVESEYDWTTCVGPLETLIKRLAGDQ